jgi:hypothetical protein
MKMREPEMRSMVRRAAGWHAQRPSTEDLRELAEVLLEVVPDAMLPAVVHELAIGCRFTGAETAYRNLIRDHNRRTSHEGGPPPPLAGKARGFHRSCSSRSVWAWLACR